ncbi:MAG: polysaccharide biosynthesis/export protein, partial [uncultured bacterium]
MADSKICSRINAGSLLLAGLMLATVVSPVTIVSAEELNADTVAVPLSEPQLAGKVAVYHDEETYGLSKLAGLAERSRPAIADERLAEEVSFIVAGGISNPGEYSLRSPVDILDAVLAAGGPSTDGSMRRVKIYQTGTLLGEYDLYSFLSEGRIADDFIFNGGEQVVVLSCGPRVSVSGSVRAPAVFELKDGEMTLGRVLEFAGGFSYGLGIYHVEVVRVADSRQQVVFSADIDAGADVPVFSLEPGDRIGVLRSDKLRLADVYVQLPGNLCGNFGYRPDMRVSDLLGCLQPLPE